MRNVSNVVALSSAALLGSSVVLGCVVREGRYSDPAPPPPSGASPVAASPAPPPPAPPSAPSPAPAPPAHAEHHAATAPAPAAAAPAPGPSAMAPLAKHPAYIRALADLRDARANLERNGGDKQLKWDEHDAIAAIDRAINNIREAAVDDDKRIAEHTPVDAHEPRAGRLHKALAALRAAHGDVDKEEDNAFANGLRARALHDIDEAIRFTEAGIQAAAQLT